MSGRAFINRLRQTLRSQRGYSLVELVVAMAIFAIIMISATAVFVAVSQSSSKTNAQRRVQQDARSNLEEIARQTRSSAIDYAFYKATSDSRCDLNETTAQAPALALRATEASEGGSPVTKRVVYYYDADEKTVYKLERSEASAPPSCDDLVSGSDRIKLTSGNVTVESLMFYLSPTQDPYDKSPTCGSECQLARNTHPRVTTVLTTSAVGTGGVGASTGAQSGRITIQTTIDSRSYPFDRLVP